MSRVTNLILCMGIRDIDDPSDKTEAVNRFFGESKGLVSVHDPSLPNGWYGGNKYLETGICIGAFNYLDLDAFLGHLRSIGWQDPEEVQVLAKEQEDDRFRLIDLFPTPDPEGEA